MKSPHPEHDAYIRGLRNGFVAALWFACVATAMGFLIYSIVQAT